MLCAIALALLINNYLSIEIEATASASTINDTQNTVLKFVNCIILILLVVRFFHRNIVFINKNYFELKKLNSVNMFVDLSLMLIQALLIIGMSIVESKKAYDVVMALIFTDALWMLFVVAKNNFNCSEVVPVAIKWLVANLLTAFMMLNFRLMINQELKLNISNMIIVLFNIIINFYMCYAFLKTERECNNSNDTNIIHGNTE